MMDRRFVIVAGLTLLSLAARASDRPLSTTPIAATRPLPPSTPTAFFDLEEAKITLSPNPPQRGERVTLTIEIPNRDTRAWEISPKVLVGTAALFHAASDKPPLRPRDTQPFLGVAWSPLLLPQRSTGTIELELILRRDPGDPLVLDIDLSGRAAGGYVASRREQLQIELTDPIPDTRPSRPFLWLIAGWFLLSLLVVPTARLLWHSARDVSEKSAEALRIGSLTVLAIGVIDAFFIAAFAFGDWNAEGRYTETTCRITDRMLVEHARTSSSRGRRSVWFAPILAVNVTRPNGVAAAIAGDDDVRSLPMIKEADAWSAIQRYRIGESYRCWIDARSRYEVTFENEIVVTPYVFMGILLLLVALPGFLWRRPRSSPA